MIVQIFVKRLWHFYFTLNNKNMINIIKFKFAPLHKFNFFQNMHSIINVVSIDSLCLYLNLKCYFFANINKLFSLEILMYCTIIEMPSGKLYTVC